MSELTTGAEVVKNEKQLALEMITALHKLVHTQRHTTLHMTHTHTHVRI